MAEAVAGTGKARLLRKCVFWAVLAALLIACVYGSWLVLLYTGLPTEVPDDFEVEYSTGPCHAEWGPRHCITVRRKPGGSGPPEFEVVRWMLTPPGQVAPPVKIINSTRPVSPEKLLDLYREICWQRFFSMRDRYYDPGIIDGGGGRLEVVAEGRKKSVTATNIRVRAFDRIAAKVGALP